MTNTCEHQTVMTSIPDIVHPDHTALLVVDVQNDFMHPNGVVATVLGQDISHVRAALPKINDAINAAHDHGVPVVYIQETIAKETILPNFVAMFGPWEQCAVRAGTWGAELLEELVPPADGDVLIQKPCYDAFQDTSLDVHLRSMGVRTCVYAGGATNVCVEATARHGFVAGYYTVLLDDACGTATVEEHAATMKTFRRRYGPVLLVDDLGDVWNKTGALSVGD
jgi:nicotinamidase-related amidase